MLSSVSILPSVRFSHQELGAKVRICRATSDTDARVLSFAFLGGFLSTGSFPRNASKIPSRRFFSVSALFFFFLASFLSFSLLAPVSFA